MFKSTSNFQTNTIFFSTHVVASKDLLDGSSALFTWPRTTTGHSTHTNHTPAPAFLSASPFLSSLSPPPPPLASTPRHHLSPSLPFSLFSRKATKILPLTHKRYDSPLPFLRAPPRALQSHKSAKTSWETQVLWRVSAHQHNFTHPSYIYTKDIHLYSLPVQGEPYYTPFTPLCIINNLIYIFSTYKCVIHIVFEVHAA